LTEFDTASMNISSPYHPRDGMQNQVASDGTYNSKPGQL